jgi:hypothetical protein
MKENNWRMGVGQVHPYRFYYLAMTPFKNFEIDGRMTEIIGVSAADVNPAFTGYGNVKDKSMDFKFRLIEESKYLPAIAFGIMDPQGTRNYASQYIVASKQIYPFDFTVGMGNGRFGKVALPPSVDQYDVEILSNTMGWLQDSQIFAGVQFAPTNWLTLMAEYSPIKYEVQIHDSAQRKYFLSPVASKFNFGLRLKPTKWSEIGLTFQRGDTIGVSLSTVFEMGKPFIPIYDRPYKEKAEVATYSLEKRLEIALSKSGFQNIGISVDGSHLRIEAENVKYYYAPRALEVILKIAHSLTGPGIQLIDVVFTQNGIPMVEHTCLRSDLEELYNNKLTKDEFFFLSRMNTSVNQRPDVKIKDRRWIGAGLKPSFETLINSAEKFFMYRLGVEAWAELHPWEGFTVAGGVQGYPLNDISATTRPLADSVRSDIFQYKSKNFNMGRLMVEQMYKASHEIYSRLAAGYLEIEYAGLDGEIAMPLWGGRVLIGLGGSATRKRDPDNIFMLKPGDDKVYNTQFFNTRFNVPEYNIWLDFKTGRFLAGDYGTVVTLTKNIHGLMIFGWYSFTNTNSLQAPENRGYHDKGVGISLPMRLFDGTDSKTSYGYSISPWTRDVGQDIMHYNSLFDFIGRNLKVFWDHDTENMK